MTGELIRKTKDTIGRLGRDIQEVERQRGVLSDFVSLRLREFVNEKNQLTQEVNREIEEFNVMYEEFSALSSSLGVSIEDLLMEGFTTDIKS